MSAGGIGKLAFAIACALDPSVVMEAMGLEPDLWQRNALRSGSARMLLLCCRQSGKSTVAVVLALATALARDDALLLLPSPSLRQSQELFKRVLGAYRAIGGRMIAPVDAESALRVEFKNGSRIISLPGTEATVRGFSGVHLLVVDEAARVSDDLYLSVRRMLARAAAGSCV